MLTLFCHLSTFITLFTTSSVSLKFPSGTSKGWLVFLIRICFFRLPLLPSSSICHKHWLADYWQSLHVCVLVIFFFIAVVDQLSENISAVKKNYHNRPLVAGYKSLTSPSYAQLYIMQCMIITAKMNTLLVLSLSVSPYLHILCNNVQARVVCVRVCTSFSIYNMIPSLCLCLHSMCIDGIPTALTQIHTKTCTHTLFHQTAKPPKHTQTLVSNISRSSVTNKKEPGDWQVARQLWFIKWGLQLLFPSP